MSSADRTAIARASHENYETGDGARPEELLAGDFTFSSPADAVGIGSRFRNTAILGFDGDRIAGAEVYLGWNL